VHELLCGWSFEPPLDAVIHALKFGRLEFLGQHLAADLHRLFAEELQETDVVIPIPLHWSRRIRRGYDQAEAIAGPLARLAGRPLVKALRRTRSTRPQARLDRRQRLRNLRLAFATSRGLATRLSGRRVLLVDDVVTTGATLEAAALCLAERGTGPVTALTAAQTPGHPRRQAVAASAEGGRGL
jgi:ComF family protein